MLRKLPLAVVSVLVLVPAASAADLDILNSNNQIAAQFVTANFDYLESFSGAKLDSEGGWVNGAGVNFVWQGEFLVRNLYFNAQYTYLNGKTDYSGSFLQGGGAYGSLLGKDGATVNDLDFRIGKGYEIGRDLQVTPYFGIGYHDWQRGANTGEEYWHGYAGAGLLAQWNPLAGLVLSAHGLAGGTFDSQVAVHTIPGPGGIIGSTLALRGADTERLGFAADYAVTSRIHVNAGVEWVHFSYGHSNLDPTGTYFEPDSRTNNTAIKAGAGYAWGAYEPLK
jgi:hypothetical protein